MDDREERTLGSELVQLRALKGESLRLVAEAADISSAYLLKLERDEVQTPSPHVLRRIATHYGVSYLQLMRVAGYEIADGATSPSPVGVLASAIAAEPLTQAEEKAMTAFLATLRAQR